MNPAALSPHWGHPHLAAATAGRVRCLVCPHACALGAGEVGVCGVRANVGGRMANLVYGRVAAAGVEPIEKKPVFHFGPAHRTFSLGAAGCNLRCDFCQNWEISQVSPGAALVGRELSPEAAVAAALAGACQSLCFTFTEAGVNLEYVVDTAQVARAAGVKVVLLTGAYLTDAAAALLAPWVDCVKIDLKGPDDAFYRAYVGGRIGPVVAAWRAFNASTWVEVSTVLLAGRNEGDDAIRRMAALILDVGGPHTPWHLMRFFPSFRMAAERPGQLDAIRHARAVARAAGLHHVYVSNVPGVAEAHTHCPACGTVVVRRGSAGQIGNELQNGQCPTCRTPIAGRWADAAPRQGSEP